jgi:hypothetical protein
LLEVVPVVLVELYLLAEASEVVLEGVETQLLQ